MVVCYGCITRVQDLLSNTRLVHGDTRYNSMRSLSETLVTRNSSKSRANKRRARHKMLSPLDLGPPRGCVQQATGEQCDAYSRGWSAHLPHDRLFFCCSVELLPREALATTRILLVVKSTYSGTRGALCLCLIAPLCYNTASKTHQLEPPKCIVIGRTNFPSKIWFSARRKYFKTFQDTSVLLKHDHPTCDLQYLQILLCPSTLRYWLWLYFFPKDGRVSLLFLWRRIGGLVS